MLDNWQKLVSKQKYFPFPCLYIHSKEKSNFLIYISEQETFRLNDGRPSDAHAHVHCLRSEQCTCIYDLNKSVTAG